MESRHLVEQFGLARCVCNGHSSSHGRVVRSAEHWDSTLVSGTDDIVAARAYRLWLSIRSFVSGPECFYPPLPEAAALLAHLCHALMD